MFQPFSYSRWLDHLFVSSRHHVRLLTKNEMKLVWSFNFKFRYKDDVLPLNNVEFGDYNSRLSHWTINKGYYKYRWNSTSVLYLELHLGLDWKQMISILELWTLHLYVSKFQEYKHLHMEYAYICISINKKLKCLLLLYDVTAANKKLMNEVVILKSSRWKNCISIMVWLSTIRALDDDIVVLLAVVTI